MAGLFGVSLINILSGPCMIVAQLTRCVFKSQLGHEQRAFCQSDESNNACYLMGISCRVYL